MQSLLCKNKKICIFLNHDYVDSKKMCTFAQIFEILINFNKLKYKQQNLCQL